ncbi:putative RNA-directed DNA polymerase from transposon BS [Trichonephila clavipes]|nr:putative RNA-directed DNA polymerase from transposon BS [Trichonephila clavipes]
MSALEFLHFSTEHRHPTVIEILLLRKLERKGFDIIFSWVPGHVGILGNEQADTAARSMSDHMQRPVCYQDLKTSAQNYIHRVWQETWDQQVLNKLHSIHPSTSHWAALPVRRHDVRLTRLRIGHTRFTHRHLLLELEETRKEIEAYPEDSGSTAVEPLQQRKPTGSEQEMDSPGQKAAGGELENTDLSAQPMSSNALFEMLQEIKIDRRFDAWMELLRIFYTIGKFQLIVHLCSNLLDKNSSNGFPQSSLGPKFLSLWKFCYARKMWLSLGACTVYMVDALKLPNQAPTVSGESLQKSMAWRGPDGTQHHFCLPILEISGQLLASKGPVNRSEFSIGSCGSNS